MPQNQTKLHTVKDLLSSRKDSIQKDHEIKSKGSFYSYPSPTQPQSG